MPTLSNSQFASERYMLILKRLTKMGYKIASHASMRSFDDDKNRGYIRVHDMQADDSSTGAAFSGHVDDVTNQRLMGNFLAKGLATILEDDDDARRGALHTAIQDYFETDEFPPPLGAEA